MPDFIDFYLAGLIDGDGSISIIDRHNGGIPYLMVQLSQLDTPEFRALISELGRPIWGGDITTAGRKVSRTAWCGKNAEELLARIGPCLKLKARQWGLVKEFLAARVEGDTLRLIMLAEEMKQLNVVT